MARTSVKNMPRNQQKAVFANLGNKPSTVSNMNARRESLMHDSLATESQQDKIDRVMRDSRLTHRQKMDRIAKIKSGGSSKSSTSSVPARGSNNAEVDSPAIKLVYQSALEKAEERRLKRKAYLERHPGAVFIPTKEPGVYLLKENGRTHKWIGDATETEYRVHYQGSIQGHYVIAKNKEMAKKIVAEQQGYTNKGLLVAVPWKTWKSGKMTMVKKDVSQNKIKPRGGDVLDKKIYDSFMRGESIAAVKKKHDISNDRFYEALARYTPARKKALAAHGTKKQEPKSYRVGMRTPPIGSQKGEVVKSKLMTKTQAEKLALQKRKLGWMSARAYKVSNKKDSDGDGVSDLKDCSPYNASKQDRTTFVSKSMAEGYASHKRSQGYSTKIKKEEPKKGRFGFYSIDNWAVYTGKK